MPVTLHIKGADSFTSPKAVLKHALIKSNYALNKDRIGSLYYTFQIKLH
jgi:hypothetical protein